MTSETRLLWLSVGVPSGLLRLMGLAATQCGQELSDWMRTALAGEALRALAEFDGPLLSEEE